MLDLVVKLLILSVPILMILIGIRLLRIDGLIRKLGRNWIGIGIVSAIITVYLELKYTEIEYILGILFIQVLLFLIATMLFQIRFIIQNKKKEE